jgi:precorrin isomerase/dethiobiotin synthetase
MAKVIMIQGTMSNVGKTLITTGLCRVFKQDGLKAAPFKAQNMSSNAHVLPDGRQMSRAQAIQAEACGIEASALMNPVLLKPVSDKGSEVFVNGKSRGIMSASEFFEMRKSLVPDIKRAFDALAAENDVIVIEGAGSPAEINLNRDDIVNMGLARLLGAPVLLVGDINMGGVFAQITGTLDLLSEQERGMVKAVIINKFRGDIELLRPGLKMLEEKCGKRVAGVLPHLDLKIEPEDSLADVITGKTDPREYDVLAAALRGNLDISFIYDILNSGLWEHIAPEEIEKRSFEIIESELTAPLDPDLAPIIKRVIHTTADFSFAKSLKASANFVETALTALRNGACIITDTNMAKAGINKEKLSKFGGEAFCFMSDADVAEDAKTRGVTRAVASINKSVAFCNKEKPVIYAIGNAPTALARVCELAAEGKIKPAFVIGAPVGFVNVVASKEILESSGLLYIIAEGRKGGSAVAAAICNALLMM